MVLSKLFETLNPISLNGYYEAQSSYIASSHLQQQHYTYQTKHGGKALLSSIFFYWVGGYLYKTSFTYI